MSNVVLGVFTTAFVGLSVVLSWAGWPESNHLLGFPVLMTAAIGAALLTPQRLSEKVVMHPSFVIEFASLLLFGANAATLVAAAGAVMRRLVNPRQSVGSVLVRVGSVALALQSAGFAHRALGGSVGHFTWQQALPIAVATLTYCVVRGVLADIAEPIARKQPIDPSWWKEIFANVQTHIVGVAAAVAFAELIDHGLWQILPIAAVPMICAFRLYNVHLERLWQEEQRRNIVDALGGIL